MVKKDFSQTSYIFSVVSIVLAFFQPVAGLVFGIIGLVQSKKQKSDFSNIAKKLSIIGIVISVVVLILSIVAASYLASNGLANLPY